MMGGNMAPNPVKTELREPFARRGELWTRVANATSSRSPADDSLLRHPEMVELILAQQAEQQSLAVHHAEERVRLAVTIRRQASQ